MSVLASGVFSLNVGIGDFLEGADLEAFDGSFQSSLFGLKMKMRTILDDRFIDIDDLYKIGVGPITIRDLIRFGMCRLVDDTFTGFVFGVRKESYVLVPSPKLVAGDLLERWPGSFEVMGLTENEMRLLLATGRSSGWLLLKKEGNGSPGNGTIQDYPGGKAAFTASVIWAALLYWIVRRKPLYPGWVRGIHPDTLIRVSTKGKIRICGSSASSKETGDVVLDVDVNN